MATIIASTIKVEVSYDTVIASALALIEKAEALDASGCGDQFKLDRLYEIRNALLDLGWTTSQVEEPIGRLEQIVNWGE
jgi:hypothetical protein